MRVWTKIASNQTSYLMETSTDNRSKLVLECYTSSSYLESILLNFWYL